MTFGGYDAFDDPYCYKGTHVLQGKPFRGSNSFDEFAKAAADFLAELNAIHPFREGNGRSQLSFLHLVALRAEHPLDLIRVDAATFLPAMIASFGGELGPLEGELVRLRR